MNKQMNISAIVPGSLGAMAEQNNSSLAETFLSCDVLLLVDMSGSMSANDAPDGLSRYEAAERDIVNLQGSNQGKIALVVFGNYCLFCPGGIPDRLGGSTDLAGALRFIKPADDCGLRIIVISDGEPNSERDALKVAAKFKSSLQTVYCGPEDDHAGGRRFLKKLANATGGQAVQSDAPGLVGEQVEKLMVAG